MKKLILGFLIGLCSIQAAFAGGLNTTFGEVSVENLPLGKTYSLEKQAKTPLIINNTSKQKVKLKIEVLLPQKSELKEGFMPVPDINWIELKEKQFVVEPNQSAKTDVFISVPDDKQYLGKKYQVFIWSHTVGRAIGVGLKSKLLLTVEQEAKNN